VVPGVVLDVEEGSAGSEVGSLSGGCLDARRVPAIFLVSAWAKDRFRCGLVPQGGGEIGASVRVW
jgi:hypothetical protein